MHETVVPLPQVPISPEIYDYSATIEDDINTVSGISEYARGAMPEIRRTATEASIIADAQNARAADKLAIVELSIGAIARRVIQLMQQYMTGEQMARISRQGGESMYVPYKREDIVGEYDFSVEGGSTQPMNDTIRKQQAVSLLNAVAPLIGVVIDPAAIAIHILETGFGIKDPQKYLIQQQQAAPAPDGAAAGAPPVGAPVAPPPPPGPPLGGGGALGASSAFAPTGGVPPELVAQLQNQMGFDLPTF